MTTYQNNSKIKTPNYQSFSSAKLIRISNEPKTRKSDQLIIADILLKRIPNDFKFERKVERVMNGARK